MKMELNTDILRVIAGLSDETITLVSKTMRDGYFSKNGIWIHLGMQVENKVDFPEYFYKYRVNLNYIKTLLGLRYDLDDNMEMYLSNIYTISDDKLISHVYENTRYIRDIDVLSLKSFSGPLRVDGVQNFLSPQVIDILEKSKISGALLSVGDFSLEVPLSKLLERVKDLDCALGTVAPLNMFSDSDVKNIIPKLTYTSDACGITEGVLYPEVTELSFITSYSPDTCMDGFVLSNFPKLKKIYLGDIILFSLIYEKIKNTKIEIKVYDFLTEEDYGKISRDKIVAKMILDDDMGDQDLNSLGHTENIAAMKKWGIGYMSVSYIMDTIPYADYGKKHTKIIEIIGYYVDFHLTIDVIYDSVYGILEGILADSTVYHGQIVRFKNNKVLRGENVVRLANMIWEKKKLYIDLDYIGMVPYCDIEKYRKYRPTI